MNPQKAQLSLSEAVALGAKDSVFFKHYFFPQTARLPSPQIHRDVWEVLERPGARKINVLLPRNWAKTTELRIFAAKRTAYQISHTIVWLGKSEAMAIRSLDWLRQQVEFNPTFAQTFGLRKGRKWQGTEAEIVGPHGPTWILAVGIEGSVRGLNLMDYRPDLFILDDIISDENSGSLEMRTKIEDAVEGAILPTLVPPAEDATARLVMLNTPQHLEDVSQKTLGDPTWVSLVRSCWTPETEKLPLQDKVSSWEERFPTEQLRRDYEGAVARNKAYVWIRENECKLIAPALCAFKPEFVQYWDTLPERSELVIVLSLDPVPPPSEIQLAKGMRDKDYESFSVSARRKGTYYSLETSSNKGHTPEWTVAEFIRLCLKWNPRQVVVEQVAYQRTLAWLLRKAMQQHGRYWPIIADDAAERKFLQKSKYDRIVDPLIGPASAGQLLFGRGQTNLVQQFLDYPNVSHEDELEAFAMGVRKLSRFSGIAVGSDDDGGDDDGVVDMRSFRRAP